MASSHRPPPTVLTKPDTNEPFGEKICLVKLGKVGRTTDEIRKTAAWIFHHRDRMPQFVKIWIGEFKRASPARRLNLYYVAHETLALCKKKRFDKGFSCFQSVLREATVYSRDRECKAGVRKVFNIFAESQFFPEEFIQSLREDLERGKSSSNYNKTVLIDFDPAVITSIHEHMQEFRESGLAKLEAQFAEKVEEKALEVGPAVISKIKEHSVGKERLQQFDSAFITMTELAEAREQDLKHEYDLLNQLELLRVYYSTTSKEADKVIVAYRNYEYAAQNGMKHLEKASGLLSIPLPGALAKAALSTAAPLKFGFKMATPAEIETVDMDMDMSDDEDTAAAKKEPGGLKATPAPPQSFPPEPPPEQSPNKPPSQPQSSSFESILSAFSNSQLSSPPFGLPHGSFLSPGAQVTQNPHYGGPSGVLSPQQRPPNFRPLFEPRIQLPPFSPTQNPDQRFFSPRQPGNFDQNRFPGQFDPSTGRFSGPPQNNGQRFPGPSNFDQNNAGRFSGPTQFDRGAGGRFPQRPPQFPVRGEFPGPSVHHFGQRSLGDAGNRLPGLGNGQKNVKELGRENGIPHGDVLPQRMAGGRFSTPGVQGALQYLTTPAKAPADVGQPIGARLSGHTVFRANEWPATLPQVDSTPIRSNTVKEITIASSPEASPVMATSPKVATPKPSTLNFDEDNFDVEPEGTEEEESYESTKAEVAEEEHQRPLLQFNNPVNFPDRNSMPTHQLPDRPPLLQFTPPNQFPPGPPPDFRHDIQHRSEFGYEQQHRPNCEPRTPNRQDFRHVGPEFRPEIPNRPNGPIFRPNQDQFRHETPNRFDFRHNAPSRPEFRPDDRNHLEFGPPRSEFRPSTPNRPELRHDTPSRHFRPDFQSAGHFPSHPPDIRMQNRFAGPPSPNIANNVRQNHFRQENLPQPQFFDEKLSRELTGGNMTPVMVHPHLEMGSGATEDISLTERLRRLAESQAGSSNIVLTSSAGPTRGSSFRPRR